MNTLTELRGTNWTGKAELWLDPLGDEAEVSECTMAVEADGVRYTWSREGKTHEGSITLAEGGAEFTDTWHQPEPLACPYVAHARGLFQVLGSYGPDQDWGWRIGLFSRPTSEEMGLSGELVLQMTNITPWGEEVRAVRMIGTRAE